MHPRVGGLYWVQTVILSGRDPKPSRPVLVLPIAPPNSTTIHVIARTSDLDARGVFHPRQPDIGLTKDGVFGFVHHRSLDVVHFSRGTRKPRKATSGRSRSLCSDAAPGRGLASGIPESTLRV